MRRSGHPYIFLGHIVAYRLRYSCVYAENSKLSNCGLANTNLMRLQQATAYACNTLPMYNTNIQCTFGLAYPLCKAHYHKKAFKTSLTIYLL